MDKMNYNYNEFEHPLNCDADDKMTLVTMYGVHTV
jgi:hypothetical protein